MVTGDGAFQQNTNTTKDVEIKLVLLIVYMVVVNQHSISTTVPREEQVTPGRTWRAGWRAGPLVNIFNPQICRVGEYLLRLSPRPYRGDHSKKTLNTL